MLAQSPWQASLCLIHIEFSGYCQVLSQSFSMSSVVPTYGSWSSLRNRYGMKISLFEPDGKTTDFKRE